jgi:hypothetical protein
MERHATLMDRLNTLPDNASVSAMEAEVGKFVAVQAKSQLSVSTMFRNAALQKV